MQRRLWSRNVEGDCRNYRKKRKENDFRARRFSSNQNPAEETSQGTRAPRHNRQNRREDTGKTFCPKYFPKDFRAQTEVDESNYYISYRRRSPEQGGLKKNRTVRINGVQEDMGIDNRWIVPYNPTLSRVFECHINVEL